MVHVCVGCRPLLSKRFERKSFGAITRRLFPKSPDVFGGSLWASGSAEGQAEKLAPKREKFVSREDAKNAKKKARKAKGIKVRLGYLRFLPLSFFFRVLRGFAGAFQVLPLRCRLSGLAHF
jgi:hypothetical protein